MGLRFRVVPRMAIEDGIHAVKMVLPRCFIDVDNCGSLINALRHYHRKFSDKERVYKIKPVHDWSSHAADAMRTLATGLNEIKFNNQQRQRLSIQTTRYYKWDLYLNQKWPSPPPMVQAEPA